MRNVERGWTSQTPKGAMADFPSNAAHKKVDRLELH